MRYLLTLASSQIPYFYFPFLSFAVALVTLLALRRGGIVRWVVDRPNQRSLHVTDVPRIGGLALMAGVAMGLPALQSEKLLAVSLPLGGVLAVSFLDDLANLSVGWRLLAHILMAGGFVVLGQGFGMDYPVASVVALSIIWMANLYNFMDGSDGLAGGMACFGFGSYALASWLAGNAGFSALNACVVTSAFAFLLFNFYPAKVFMGDAGSVPLGFLAGALGLVGWSENIWPFWFPLLVFAPFIVDATVTLFKRLWQGEKLWQAHRDHYYQRLVLMGWGHRKTALAEYVLMAACGISAVIAIDWGSLAQLVLLVGWGGVLAILMRVVDVRWRVFLKLELQAG